MAVLARTEQSGLLTVTPERAGFRHELIRRAVAEPLPGAWRIALNRDVLDALPARARRTATHPRRHVAPFPFAGSWLMQLVVGVDRFGRLATSAALAGCCRCATTY
ncbi:hypothetical protein GCM10010431_54650 [Streptomyces kunmingensis]